MTNTSEGAVGWWTEACDVLDVDASYVGMFSLQKLVKLYTCDLYTFLCVYYTSIIFFKLKK